MAWLIGAIVLIVIIAFMIASPGFRYTVLVLIAVVVGGSYVMIQNNNEKREQRLADERRADIMAQSMISASELDFTDVTFKKSFHETWELAGVVTNRSKATLDKVDLTVQLMECTKQPCITIGEAAGAFSVVVPPFQARAFSASVRLPNLPPLEMPVYNYKLGTIRGR